MRAEGAGGRWSRTIAASDPVLAQIGLVDAPAQDGLLRLAHLAADLIGAPVALVTVVQPALDRQFLAAAQGFEGPMAEARQTPLSYSFCRHVRDSGRPLMVTDAQHDPITRDNPAVVEFEVGAYLGVPIRWADGTVIGALCVMDRVARGWTEAELERLEQLARCVDDQIRLLLALHDQKAAWTRAELSATARDLMFREVNHELRTPLNGLVGAAEILADTALDSEQRQFVDVLLDSADQLTRIVEEVAAHTAKLTDPRPGRASDFDPAEVLAEVIGLSASHGGTCTLWRPGNVAAFRMRNGDTLMLRHVLYDVLRTAMTAWPSAAIEVSVDDTARDVLGIVLRSRSMAQSAALPVPRAGRALAAALRVARGLARTMGGTLRLEFAHGGVPEVAMILRLPFPEVGALKPDPGCLV